MALIQRNGIWYVRIRGPFGDKRMTTGETDKRKAKAKEADITAELVASTKAALAPRAPTLEALWDYAERTHYHGLSSLRTVLYHRVAVAEVLDMTTMRGDELTAEHYAAIMVAQRQKGNSEVTIGRIFQTFGRVLALAREAKMLADFPKPPSGVKSEERIRVYTREEEAAILAEFERYEPLMGHLTVSLIDTGLRLGELVERTTLALHPGEVELWKTKNRSGRIVPLTDRAHASLTAWLAQSRIVTKGQIESRWQTMRRNIGQASAEGFVIHALRHTCCTRLLRGGMSPFEVMKWMGHKDIKSTLRYSHLVTEDIRKGAGILAAHGLVAPEGVPAAVPKVAP